MRPIEKIFCALWIVIVLAAVAYQIHRNEACNAAGGELMRGTFGSYECLKVERAK